MKKNFLVMLLVGILSVNLLGCSEKKDTGNKEDGNKPVATEEQESKKITEKELNEKFEKNKEELSKFFKANGFEERIFTDSTGEKEKVIQWELNKEKSDNELYYTVKLQNWIDKGYINLIFTGFVKEEEFKTKKFNLDLDNSIILKAYEIFKGKSDFKYEKYSEKIEEKMKQNEVLTSDYKEEFYDQVYKHKLEVMAVEPRDNFMIAINYGNKK